jgi:hypothetical protein
MIESFAVGLNQQRQSELLDKYIFQTVINSEDNENTIFALKYNM